MIISEGCDIWPYDKTHVINRQQKESAIQWRVASRGFELHTRGWPSTNQRPLTKLMATGDANYGLGLGGQRITAPPQEAGVAASIFQNGRVSVNKEQRTALMACLIGKFDSPSGSCGDNTDDLIGQSASG